MKLGDFAVEVPEGTEDMGGRVMMRQGRKYTLRLSNYTIERCDAEVEIDGKRVGVIRIPPKTSVTLERPLHDTGCFTFYLFGTEDGRKAGIAMSDKLGLISVFFKPEWPCQIQLKLGRYDPVATHNHRRGGTGLSGESAQRFTTVKPLDYDTTRFTRINLHLYGRDEPRITEDTASPSSSQSGAAEILRWCAVVLGGLLAGVLVLVPVDLILSGMGGSIQLYLSAIVGTMVFVFVGAMIAPKKQITAAYVLFGLSAFPYLCLAIPALSTDAGVPMVLLLCSVLTGGFFGVLLAKGKISKNNKQEVKTGEKKTKTPIRSTEKLEDAMKKWIAAHCETYGHILRKRGAEMTGDDIEAFTLDICSVIDSIQEGKDEDNKRSILSRNCLKGDGIFTKIYNDTLRLVMECSLLCERSDYMCRWILSHTQSLDTAIEKITWDGLRYMAAIYSCNHQVKTMPPTEEIPPNHCCLSAAKTSKNSSDADFRKAKWGMGKREVKERESGDLIAEDDTRLLYHDLLMGKSVGVGYTFANGKLVSAVYRVLDDYADNNGNGCFDDYDSLEKMLVEEYGKPAPGRTSWAGDHCHRYDQASLGLAVRVGHFTMGLKWETRTTEILLLLRGEDQKILLEATYRRKATR